MKPGEPLCNQPVDKRLDVIACVLGYVVRMDADMLNLINVPSAIRKLTRAIASPAGTRAVAGLALSTVPGV